MCFRGLQVNYLGLYPKPFFNIEPGVGYRIYVSKDPIADPWDFVDFIGYLVESPTSNSTGWNSKGWYPHIGVKASTLLEKSGAILAAK